MDGFPRITPHRCECKARFTLSRDEHYATSENQRRRREWFSHTTLVHPSERCVGRTLFSLAAIIYTTSHASHTSTLMKTPPIVITGRTSRTTLWQVDAPSTDGVNMRRRRRDATKRTVDGDDLLLPRVGRFSRTVVTPTSMVRPNGAVAETKGMDGFGTPSRRSIRNITELLWHLRGPRQKLKVD